ncbi:MAG: PrsW family glutamic-type intramembrane protease [Streptococcus sp.]|nr:PrsW family glutamic-type intramembrane protease [Streptococcus sp.]
MSKSRRFILYIYLLLAGIGLEFELGTIARKDFSISVGQDLILSLLVLLILFVPLFIFIKKTAGKLKVSISVFSLALFGGVFISGWLGFAGNSLIDIINSNFIKDPTFFNQWTDSFTAPFAEEFFKALVAYAVLFILNKKDFQSVLIAGISSGFGFQISEDISYVSRHSLGGESSGVSEAVGRIMGGLASHALYTAVVVVGVYLILSTVVKKHRLFGWWCVLSTVVNHFIWNSQFYETSHRINILSGFLFLLQAATFIEVYLLAFKERELPQEEQS